MLGTSWGQAGFCSQRGPAARRELASAPWQRSFPQPGCTGGEQTAPRTPAEPHPLSAPASRCREHNSDGTRGTAELWRGSDTRLDLTTAHRQGRETRNSLQGARKRLRLDIPVPCKNAGDLILALALGSARPLEANVPPSSHQRPCQRVTSLPETPSSGSAARAPSQTQGNRLLPPANPTVTSGLPCPLCPPIPPES